MPPIDHGHLSDLWEDGALVFDNGDHRPDLRSRVVEYRLDLQAGTFQQTWEYWHPEGMHIPILGDARRLPDGNKLIAWSSQGRLVEVTPDGDEVWSVQTDVGAIWGRVRWLDDLYAPSGG
jgi:outer membrane protein assembly factor BamB